MYFKDIMRRNLDKSKNKKIETGDWAEYDAMCLRRLNVQVQQYDGFTPGRRVFGRAPKLPVGAVGSPHFSYFTNLNDSTVTETNGAMAKLREIQNASLEIVF